MYHTETKYIHPAHYSYYSCCMIFYEQAIFKETSTEISSIEVAQCLQSVAVVDRPAINTDTSTKISNMEIAL